MNLMTNEIKQKLNEYGLYGQEALFEDSKILVKYFNPYGEGTWLITGGEKQINNDWLLYGCINIDYTEWGYVYLSELKDLVHPLGFSLIERDLYLDENTTVKDELKYLL